jgi:hypothetical protein
MESENKDAEMFASIMGRMRKYTEYTNPNALATRFVNRNP